MNLPIWLLAAPLLCAQVRFPPASGCTICHSRIPAGVRDPVAPQALWSPPLMDNLTGHNLPTGFPSRRVWLRLTVSDSKGSILFESGAGDPGAQPHHALITRPGQAQVIESESADAAGRPTVSLLRAVRHFKDNRILPAGFTESRFRGLDIAPHGVAAGADFSPGRAVTRYAVNVPEEACRVTV